MGSIAEIEAARAELAIWHDAHNGGLSPLPFGDVNWTYDGDRHVPASRRLPAIVMGINPGGGNGAAEPGMSASERKWRSNCVKLTERAASEIAFAELVCIPTRRVADLEAGLTVAHGIEASRRLNNAIMEFHRPNAIYQMGFLGGSLASTITLYGLEPVATVMRPNGKGRLLVHYRMPTGLNWLSIRHFAAFGFSDEDFGAIHKYVAGIERGPASLP